MSKNSCNAHMEGVLEQVKSLNKLVKILYKKNLLGIGEDSYEKVKKSLRTAEKTIKELSLEGDVSTSGSAIFSGYLKDVRVENFEDYFYKNLNPDVAVFGFLEELDKLIAISKKRKIIVVENSTDIDTEYVKVLKDYLHSLPPF